MEPNESPCFNGYESYPLNLRCPTIEVNDLRYLHSELEKASPSLFVDNRDGCQVRVFESMFSASESDIRSSEESVLSGGKGTASPRKLVSNHISSLNEMRDTLERELPHGSTRLLLVHVLTLKYWRNQRCTARYSVYSDRKHYSILNRFNSWSRLTITLEMFRALCAFDQITPLFLNLIFGFGKKSKSFDEDYMACYHHFSTSDDAATEVLSKNRDGVYSQDDIKELRATSYDLCYNVRHFELHERDLEDPWSCRQSAIHQKYYFTAGRSNWIIVQPPKLFLSALEGIQSDKLTHPIGLHVLYIAAAMANWRSYLNYITEKLTQLDSKVSFPTPFKEFEISFSFSQRIHSLRKKLYHARCILENTRDTLASVRSHAQTVAQMSSLSISQNESFNSNFANISSEICNHLSTTRRLLQFSEDIKLMSNDILRFKDQELLYDNGLALARIGQADALQRRLMMISADATARDSRTMRIATVVAILYLPSNLVMAFFSSNLIELNNTHTPGQGEVQSKGILVHRQIWVAIVTILVLTSFTLLTTVYYDRKGKERLRSVQIEEPGTELRDLRVPR